MSDPVPLTTEERERLEELCQKATEGKWSAEMVGYSQGIDASIEVWGGESRRVLICQTIMREIAAERAELQRDEDNTAFIAAARTALPALLHEVRQSRQGWIPVSEKLPDELGIYMVYAPFPVVDGDPRIDIYRYDPDAKGRNPNWGWKEVIAWRPLPAAPDKE